MTTPKVVLALITRDNDYQREQAAVAETVARRLGFALEVLYADGEAIGQTRQLLNAIQNPDGERPRAIIVEPVGTGMLSVATAAARNGIGWVVLNRGADYLAQLRQDSAVPIGCVETDNFEVGRIQGRQFTAMLPGGGSVLYIEGPGEAAKQRRSGLDETRAANIEILSVRGKWTAESGQQAVVARLPQAQQRPAFDLIGSQNDAMAMGARKAAEELPDPGTRAQCLRIPFTGVDGVPTGGQQWVKEGLLAATIITPVLTGVALELVSSALANGTRIPERTLATPQSYPPIEQLKPIAQ